MNFVWLATALAATLPALYFRLGGAHAGPLTESAIFGIGILGAAFLLTWAAEVAEMDISQSLALVFLALVAVLPEYAVDLYFAWAAAQDPAYAHYAIANMTGGNRLLIGIGWSLVVFLFWVTRGKREIFIERSRGNDLFILGLATLYAFIIPIKGSLSLMDTVVFLILFVAYLWMASRSEQKEPELVGPPELIGVLPTLSRRIVTIVMFVFSAFVILASAEPFADGLVTTGKTFGIDEFLLVQWLAPLASEAPEIVVACIFVLRNSATMALGALVSSKVNQWTLLVGTLPIVYSISLGRFGALPMDARQSEEVLLTAAQSAFAVALLLNFSLSRREAGILFSLFAVQLLFPDPTIRYAFSGLYMIMAVFVLARDRGRLRNVIPAMPWTTGGPKEQSEPRRLK